MFGNDNGGDGGDDGGFGLGQLLFGLWVWREIDSGRLDVGQLFKALFLIAAVLGGGFMVLLAIASASMPRYDGSYDAYAPYTWQTEAPAVVPAWTPAPAWTPEPTPTASPTPKPTRIPGIGKKVPAGEGWWVRVDKVRRWKPSWYRQPGWRLVTAYLTVRIPATGDACLLGSDVVLIARSGNEYEGWIGNAREPSLAACSDYHRRTTARGWVTFEVRDQDAKGLVLSACPDWAECEPPAMIRIN